jgi:SAM-dependent methyltransferase
MSDISAFDAFEAAGWEKAASEYDRFFGPITARVAEPLLDAARVGPATRVLDVATGPGYVAARAAERGAVAVGVDISEQMVLLARTLHPAIDFQQGDVGRLAFGGDSFDAVVGNFALPHLVAPELAVAGFARVLGDRGMLALSMWDVPERARVLGLIVDAVERSGATPPADLPAGPPFFRFSSDAELSRLLHDAGFDEVEVRTLSFTHRLSGADELWQGVLGGTVRTAPLVLGQPTETRRRIRATFDRLAGEYAVGDSLEVPVSVKVAAGRKRQPKPARR